MKYLSPEQYKADFVSARNSENYHTFKHLLDELPTKETLLTYKLTPHYNQYNNKLTLIRQHIPSNTLIIHIKTNDTNQLIFDNVMQNNKGVLPLVKYRYPDNDFLDMHPNATSDTIYAFPEYFIVSDYIELTYGTATQVALFVQPSIVQKTIDDMRISSYSIPLQSIKQQDDIPHVPIIISKTKRIGN